MLIDGHGRKVDYIRVSVTERCNFRCNYCMPEKPFSWVPKENLLSFEDLFKFIKASIDQGIKKVRITGGEPLLRYDLDKFVKLISDYDSEVDLALTTNGYLLVDTAQKLKDAGLKRLNISLDSLKVDVAGKIANKNVLKDVLAGINKADEVGLKIKINSVPMKGVNDDEIVDLIDYCMEKGWTIRFIEYMENSFAKSDLKGLASDEIKKIVSQKYNFKELPREDSSPAVYYELTDEKYNGYKFGIIEPHKDDFCSTCNRIRLTAEGMLIPCLYFEDALSIKDCVQKDDIDGAVEVLKTVLKNKPEKNKWASDEDGTEVSSRAFYETGG